MNPKVIGSILASALFASCHGVPRAVVDGESRNDAPAPTVREISVVLGETTDPAVFVDSPTRARVWQDDGAPKDSPTKNAKAGNALFKSLGRFSYTFHTGVILSQDKSRFSHADPLIRFRGDTAWGDRISEDKKGRQNGLRWDDLHTYVDLALTSIPVESLDANTNEVEFIDSEKSFSGKIGFDYRLYHFKLVDDYTVALGPTGGWGIDTLTGSAADNVETTSDHWTAGFRLAGYDVAKKGGEIPFNPIASHYASIQFGDFGILGSKRVVVDLGLLLDKGTGLFVGLRSNTGRGKDDIRLMIGFASSMSAFIEAVTGMIPDGLKAGG